MLARSLARLRAQNRGVTVPEDPRRLQRWISLAQMTSGVRLTMDDAMQLSVVWACVMAISKAIAASPCKVFARLPNGDRDEMMFDPLVYLLNTRPCPDTTAIALREAQLISALTWGNGYWEIVFDGAGRVVELWPLLPDRVEPRRDMASGALVYDYCNPETNGTVTLQSWQVFHLKGPSIDGLLGSNMIAQAVKAIALAVAAEQFSSSYFGNGATIGGVMEYPNSLGDAAYERLKKEFKEKQGGLFNAHNPLILEGGMKWTPIGNDPEKSQLIESRKFQLEEICRWYGVPPHKVGHLDRATWDNIEQLGLEFARDALRPWSVRFQQEADYKLFSVRGRPRFCLLDLAWVSEGDAKTRAETNQIKRRNGVISVNDWLRTEGENTIGAEGDIRIVEGNMTRLEDVGQKPAPAPAQAAEPAEDEDDGPTVEDAAATLLTASFERHGKRIKNRAADLLARKKPQDEVAQNLAKLREQTLRDDFGPAVAFLVRLTGADEADAFAACATWTEIDCEPRHAAEAIVKRFTGTDAELSAAMKALTGGG